MNMWLEPIAKCTISFPDLTLSVHVKFPLPRPTTGIGDALVVPGDQGDHGHGVAPIISIANNLPIVTLSNHAKFQPSRPKTVAVMSDQTDRQTDRQKTHGLPFIYTDGSHFTQIISAIRLVSGRAS